MYFLVFHGYAIICAANDVNVTQFCTNSYAMGYNIHLDASVAVSIIGVCRCDFTSSRHGTVYINVKSKPNGSTSNCWSVVSFNFPNTGTYFNITCDSTQTAFVVKQDEPFFVTLLNKQIGYGPYCISLRTGYDATTLNGRCFSSRESSGEITTNKPLTKDKRREPINKEFPIEILGAAVGGGAVCIALAVVIIVCYRREKHSKQKSNESDNICENHGGNLENEIGESHQYHNRNIDNSTCEITDVGGGYAATWSNNDNFKHAIRYDGGGGYAEVGSKYDNFKHVISYERGEGGEYAGVASNIDNVKLASIDMGGGYAEVGSFKDVISGGEGGGYAEVGSNNDNVKHAIRYEGVEGHVEVELFKHAIGDEGGGYAEVGSNNDTFIHVIGEEEWGGYAEVGLTQMSSATQASSKYSLSQNQIIQEQEQQDVVPVYAMPDKTKHRNEENNGPVYAMQNKTKKKNNPDDTGPVQAIQNTKHQNVSADETGPVYALPDKKKTKGAEQKKRTAKPTIATKPKLGINEINQA